MTVLPPGTLLQLMYLRERLGQVQPRRFIEIGPGSGEITQLLLDLGWVGESYDLDAQTIEKLGERFAGELKMGRYKAINADYLALPILPEKADLIISCMVMEHLNDRLESEYMKQSLNVLAPGGLMIGLVPGSPAHWGIEDDIAGHCRRYTRGSIRSLMLGNRWKLQHLIGLTFPVSNLLLPVSNFLVNRSEKAKLSLSEVEKTKSSGRRSVKFKTFFPSFLGLILNRWVLLPAYWLQKIFGGSERALVLYFEATPDDSGAPSGSLGHFG